MLFPKYLQDELSDPEGKTETRQTFGNTVDLGIILQSILYWNCPTPGHPKDVFHLNREDYLFEIFR